jgi:hypothetical protein
MTDQQYDNTNRGVLFKNDDKKDDRDADYRGNINVGGVEYWLDAWINTAKTSGKKFMALRVKPKEPSAAGKTTAAAPPDDFDDPIPF